MENPKLSPVDRLIKACLDNKLVTGLVVAMLIVWSIIVAPFDWQISSLPRDPVPVDAIPDIGENQQIVFTQWAGRSPQDVEDQITYPLTVSLLGIPDVKTVRSYSMFGFSTIYVIFKEDAEFYWSRSRILEKLNSLPAGTLPQGVQPSLGPDATALGQVFWYTLEGEDEKGNPTGGWDLQELRSIQDWTVRYALQSAEGISEIASVGGHVKEYQIDVDPTALQEYGVSLTDVFNAVRRSNLDVGARTIEINRVEYVVRGLGFVRSPEDLENTVVSTRDNVPLYIKDIGNVVLGPALRRGILDKEGAEAVGGVAIVRYGENPLAAIKHLKEKIKEISPGLPSKILPDGRKSQVHIVPFYDRTGLINETLGTLNHALRDEILITIIVILLMVMHLRTSLMISTLLPLTVLLVFIAMKLFGVDANIVALSGIAIAIGTIVDMGIVVSENILKHLESAPPEESRRDVIFRASSEVGSAVLTAVSTTVVSFLPVFTMDAAEGKLFKPLAYTKTFALILSVLITLTILPPLAHILLGNKSKSLRLKTVLHGLVILAGLVLMIKVSWWIGLIFIAAGLWPLAEARLSEAWKARMPKIINWTAIVVTGAILAKVWAPLGYDKSTFVNFLFVTAMLTVVMGALILFTKLYPTILRYALDHKATILSLPVFLVIFGFTAWLGIGKTGAFLPAFVTHSHWFGQLSHRLPGIGKEFMPPLDEGSFLYMPTTMPHAGVEEVEDVLKTLDMALYSVPEVESVVGKAGRADTALDPAPLSMIESIITYKSEYKSDEQGNRMLFAVNEKGEFKRDSKGELIPDSHGKPFRQWRPEIHSNSDIWKELVKAAQLPGTTSAPKLQPISARIVMLQSGMRAPMGIKVKGPSLESIESTGLALEKILKDVPSVQSSAVFADRIVGKPYLEIVVDRKEIARFGISMEQFQMVVETAIGGMKLTTSVEGRERYPIRVRYMREYRGSIEDLKKILIPASDGTQVPLGQLAKIQYVRGPQVIKSEDTFLVSYVLFDKKDGHAEVDVVEDAQRALQQKLESGELVLPAGVSYSFAGSYENQVRAMKKLRLILPLALFLIFLILWFQFKSVPTTLIVFSGILVAWAGGFTMLWLYSQGWFLNFHFGNIDMRSLFQIHPVNLSVAVWVGFLALFGIATDDGVIISTYLEQSFAERKPSTVQEIREAVIFAGSRRIRPAMMTAATTILALIPVLSSSGRGADVMVPMAIPSFGGMVFVILTTFVVPILYSTVAEAKVRMPDGSLRSSPAWMEKLWSNQINNTQTYPKGEKK